MKVYKSACLRARFVLVSHALSRYSPNTQIVVAFASRVPVTVGIQLMVLVFVRVQFLDFIRSQSVDHSRIEFIHLLTLDDLVPELGNGLTR